MLNSEFIEFIQNKIKVERIEFSDFDFILYKATDSEEYYIAIVLNHSFAYYDKLVKVDAADIQEYLNGKILTKHLVDKYR
jgi:hypothetical protein